MCNFQVIAEIKDMEQERNGPKRIDHVVIDEVLRHADWTSLAVCGDDLVAHLVKDGRRYRCTRGPNHMRLERET